MAIKLIANYSKRLGLPGYSSHQFSISVETELMTTDDIPVESGRIYHLLQSNVDEQIQSTGFVPPTGYGMEPPGEPPPSPAGQGPSPAWKCSDKQKDLILRIVEEHQLDKTSIDDLAKQRFGKNVRLLNKVEASGLIDELLDGRVGANRPAGRSRNGNAYGRRAA